ncbi:MAG: hypothetical protein M1838_004836 [Thelocarpon superellum]|nr:MAG: hypothetical protein M1838_004836 [Thelocarpon superellum]
MFHGDLMLSKCARESMIVLWRIEGFSSTVSPPAPDAAPSTYEPADTRSAFGGRYQRLLQFAMPNTGIFYMRFSLFGQPHQHPILAMGDESGKVLMWDLQKLEGTSEMAQRPMGRSGALISDVEVPRDEGLAPAVMSKATDPLKPLRAHWTIDIPDGDFCARQAAWSVGGEWLVVVGDASTIGLMRR